jgi:F0F1-type ATP synthase assembly protein I
VNDHKDLNELKKKIGQFKRKFEPIKKENYIGDSYKLSNIAVEIVTIPIVAAAFGYFLDKIFNSLPIFLLICLIFGVISSFVYCYRIINKDIDKK